MTVPASPPDDILSTVVKLLEQHAVTPTPENYLLWHTYVTAENTALCAEIDALRATGATLTQAKLDEVRLRHLPQCQIEARANSRIAKVLVELIEELSGLDSEASRYGEALAEHLKKIQTTGAINDMEALLMVLANETRAMRSSTQTLRDEFTRRSNEIAEIQAELQSVKLAANSDPLTGLMNRRALLESLTELNRFPDHHHALLMLDIDHFKAINDQHGHLVGDRVIRFVADVIRQHTRGQDTPCRFGGEEFAVLLPETHLAGALTVAEKIRAVVAAAKLVRATNQEPIGQITLSGGVASYHAGEDGLELMDRADRALYMAKDRGRNKVLPETALDD